MKNFLSLREIVEYIIANCNCKITNEKVLIMKSYKLNKTLENSTYPIEQELKNLNRSSQTNTVKTIITVSTIVFSGIATSFIYENNLFDSTIKRILNCWEVSLEQFFFCGLAIVYGICVIINLIIFFRNKSKERPKNMKKSEYGRKNYRRFFISQ